MIKERLIRLGACALCLWYILCIVGFDVHECSHSGHSYLATAYAMEEGCLSIHPNHLCCEDENELDCCSDSFYHLDSFHLRDDGQQFNTFDVFTLHSLVQSDVFQTLFPATAEISHNSCAVLRPCAISENIQSQLGIFRI